MSATGTFLSADWRFLLMLNYEVDPSLLQPHVPEGTELDLWHGKAIASMVGFRFLKTKVLGILFPGHRDFDEVNLRFYVRRDTGSEVRRGVVFIREIVPKRIIATVARVVYNENYVALPMRHHLVGDGVLPETASYEWRLNDHWYHLMGQGIGAPAFPTVGSEEEFTTEHYWGYSEQKNGTTVEYQVEHPQWLVASVAQPELECDVAELYGAEFVEALAGRPRAAFMADGSEVLVRSGRRVRP
jgi:uncharacterized protein YqjF (DUF2071 family)